MLTTLKKQRAKPVVELFTPILSVDCLEDGKKVTRNISKFFFTPSNVKQFYDKARKYPVLFGKRISNEKEFLDHFIYLNRHDEPELNGMFWVDQDLVTVFYITDIFPTECSVHYTFLDGRQKGREELVSEMIKYVFTNYNFNRLNASVPVYAKTAISFARRVGFVDEGRKRKSSFWKDQYFDEAQFGILKSEALGG